MLCAVGLSEYDLIGTAFSGSMPFILGFTGVLHPHKPTVG